MFFGSRPVAHCGPAEQLAGLLAALDTGHEACMTASGPAIPPLAAGETLSEPVLRCLSGGTSGHPSQVRRTHASWIRCFAVNREILGLSPGDTYAVLGGLPHSLALYAAIEAVHLGADLDLLSAHSPRLQIERMRAGASTILYATPSQIGLLNTVPGPDRRRKVPSLRKLLVGGSKLQPGQIDAARRLFPNAGIHEFFGSTETSFISIGGPDTAPGSVGRAYPGVEIRFGDRAAAHGRGVLRVRSPYTAIGYARGKTGTARWRNGFVMTGDVGSIGTDGCLYLHGRSDRSIKVADKAVHPEEVETVIQAIEGVTEAAAVPVPDPLRGSVLTAFVRVASDGPAVSAIEQECRRALDPLKCPKRIVALNRWPLLASGKTDLGALRDLIGSRGR